MRQKICTKGALSWGQGVVECRTWPCLSWEIELINFFKMSFLHFKTYFMHNLHKIGLKMKEWHFKVVVTLTQQFKSIIWFQSFYCLQCSFQNAWPIKRKAVILSTFPYIHSFPCGMWELDQIPTRVSFKNTSSIILVHL